DLTRIPAKIRVGPDNVLHWESKIRKMVLWMIHRNCFQDFQQRRACIPGHVRTSLDHIVTSQGTQGDIMFCDAFHECREIVEYMLNRNERLFMVTNQVHLVDGQNDVTYSEQPDNVSVAPRLLKDSLARIDQENGQICI